MAWVYLLLAGAFEVLFTTAMRFTEGFTRFWPSTLVLLLAAISIYLVTTAAQLMPLGTAYAAWGALGATGTILVGIVFFGEPVMLGRMIFLSMLVISIAGLRLVGQ